MIKFLKKYRFNIFLALILALCLWLISRQEDLYLKGDFVLLNKKADTYMIWTLIVGLLIILILALRKVDNKSEIVNVFGGVIFLSIPLYFVFKTIFLCAFLLLNRIELGDRVDKKYTTIFFAESDGQIPLIYDFRSKKSLYDENVKNMEKLQNLKLGDTVIISFNNGLLGFNFDPRIK